MVSQALDYKCRKKAEKHAQEMFPKEACGVIAGGQYWRCRNIADDPEKDFVLDPRDYLAARLYGGQVQAIIHSHPKGGEPSVLDKKTCSHMEMPWYIYLMPDKKWSIINP